MAPLNLGFLMDPLEQVRVDHDSTFTMMLEAQKRGHTVRYFEQAWLRFGGTAAEARMRTVTVRREVGRHFEVLEELTPFGPPPREAPDAVAPAPVVETPPPPLALAPVDVDEQIAGIGLGATERFDPEALNIGSARQVVPEPPSTLALVIAMLLAPVLVALGAVLLLRRRRNALLA